jgi:predicted nucleotidyltransferase
MTREDVLAEIRKNRDTLKKYRVKSLALFGSLARDEAREDSDVDLLVEFSESVGLFEFVRLKRFLEELLGQPVDLATPNSLKQQLREQILREAIRAA